MLKRMTYNEQDHWQIYLFMKANEDIHLCDDVFKLKNDN